MIKRILKISLLFILLGVFAWTIYFLYSKSEQPPVVYQTVSPFDTTIVKKTVATGSVIPRKEVNMKSQVSGIIEKLYIAKFILAAVATLFESGRCGVPYTLDGALPMLQ